MFSLSYVNFSAAKNNNYLGRRFGLLFTIDECYSGHQTRMIRFSIG
jgi:hypothetical protein